MRALTCVVVISMCGCYQFVAAETVKTTPMSLFASPDITEERLSKADNFSDTDGDNTKTTHSTDISILGLVDTAKFETDPSVQLRELIRRTILLERRNKYSTDNVISLTNEEKAIMEKRVEQCTEDAATSVKCTYIIIDFSVISLFYRYRNYVLS